MAQISLSALLLLAMQTWLENENWPCWLQVGKSLASFLVNIVFEY